MDDKTIERLMRYLGLAYHRATDDITPNGEWRMCACGFAYIRPERHVNRTFTTWDDLGKLKDKLVEKGEWRYFILHAYHFGGGIADYTSTHSDVVEGQYRVFYPADFIAWLMNPTRFCELVGEWLKGKSA